MERDVYETHFLDNLASMRRAMAAVCRRHGLAGADAEDFASWATLRLIEDDFAVLRQFRGESSLRTYLAVVITRLHHEYRERLWGQWRPSAAARRSGWVAVRLEMLVYRDGYALRDAILVLRTADRIELTERQLISLFTSLPRRTVGRVRTVCEDTAEALVDTSHGASAECLVLAQEADAERCGVETTLARAIASLPVEDGVIVRMRFWEGMTIADIARALRLPQKPLYRRMKHALVVLGDACERFGLSRQRVHTFLMREAS